MASSTTNNGRPGNAEAEGVPDETTPLLNRDREEDNDNNLTFAQRLKKRWVSVVVSGVLILVVIAIIAVYGVYRARGTMNTSAGLCLTPACIHAASEFLYNLAPNYQQIDPCTDIEQLVCGGWQQRHTIRPDQSMAGSFDSVYENGQNIVRSILENPYPSNSSHSTFSPQRLAVRSSSLSNLDEENFNQLQRAYNACMAMPEIVKVGVAPLENTLQELTKTFDNSSNYGKAMLFLEQHGSGAFISLGVGADDKAPDNQIIFAGPRSSPGLPAKDYYLDNDVVSQYTDVIGQVLGALKPTAQDAKRHAADLVEFEKKIAAMTPDLEELQNITNAYNPMSLADTAKLTPQLGLDYVIKSLVPSNVTVDRMITSFPNWFKNLTSLISDAPKSTVQTYIQWRLITSQASLVEAAEIKPYLRFTRKLGGRDPDAVPDRYKTCVSHVDGILGWTLSRFFVEAAFSEKSKQEGDQIVSDIKKVYIDGFSKLDWMDDSVKKLAADKVNKIVQKIGYPTKSPNIMEPKALQDYYAGINVSSSYYDNVMSSTKIETARQWANLGKPTNRDEWGMTAPTVNAYYNPAGNEIVFPAGIMQFPFFGGELPSYINYGAFGAVAGHELSHAFDPNGRLYDVDGNLKDWWTERTSKEFDKRADCFVEEYSNFTVPGPNGTLHVRGRQTLGENVADAGGLSAAWSAWNKNRKSKPDQDLPGLSMFTQEQVFYLAYSTVWCSKYTPNALVSRVLTDSHSPDMFRIKGTIMNSRGFREAFKCKQKEPVCEIW